MSRFPKTEWTLIELVHREAPTGSREQMGRLLESYRQPMYAHLRYKGLKHEQAEDLIQLFFIEVLDKDLLAMADPKRGKFRTLLLTALDRLMVSRHRYDNAVKRSPSSLASLDAVEVEPAAVNTPDSPTATFERAWALDVLAQTLAQMQRECEEAQQAARWRVFDERILGPLLEDKAVPDYGDLAQQLGLANEKAAMNLLVTAKRQYMRIMRDQIREYVTRSGNADTHIHSVEEHLVSSGNDAKESRKVAKQLIEQATVQAVVAEIDQLKLVLAQTSPTDVPDAAVFDVPDPLHAKFLRRLYQQPQDGKPFSPHLLYERGDADFEEHPMEAHLSTILDTPLAEMSDSESEKTIRETLLAKSPNIRSLETVKDWANAQRLGPSHAIPLQVASAIYYLSIAAAELGCNSRLTGLSDASLSVGYKSLLGEEWLDGELQELLRQALGALSVETK